MERQRYDHGDQDAVLCTAGGIAVAAIDQFRKTILGAVDVFLQAVGGQFLGAMDNSLVLMDGEGIRAPNADAMQEAPLAVLRTGDELQHNNDEPNQPLREVRADFVSNYDYLIEKPLEVGPHLLISGKGLDVVFLGRQHRHGNLEHRPHEHTRILPRRLSKVERAGVSHKKHGMGVALICQLLPLGSPFTVFHELCWHQ